jgi:hypothetical protein
MTEKINDTYPTHLSGIRNYVLFGLEYTWLPTFRKHKFTPQTLSTMQFFFIFAILKQPYLFYVIYIIILK